MKKCLLGLILLSWSFVSSAAFITVNNGVQVQALDLDSIASSFIDFYDFNNGVPDSSDTGFEIQDQLTVFIAELNDQLGVFALLKGKVSAEIDVTASSGSVIFVEESNEQEGPFSFDFTIYNAIKGDGFIIGDISNDENFTLDFAFPSFQGVTGYSVLDFSSTSPTVLASGSLDDGLLLSVNSFNQANVSVDAPSASALLLFGLMILFAVRVRR